jgi:hypothetical protein
MEDFALFVPVFLSFLLNGLMMAIMAETSSHEYIKCIVVF